MARARNIKPGFFQDDRLGELSAEARLVFIGLWTIADFKGCLEYRPKMLKVQILPYDKCNIDEVINNLAQARFIRFYSVGDKQYIKVVNFERHQNPHKNERDAGSDIPDFTGNAQENNILAQDGTKPDKIGTTRADSLLLIPSTLIPDSINADSPIPKPKSKAIAPLALLTSLGIDEKIAADWILLRKQKKSPVTETALDGIKREAEKAGYSLETALRVCCERGWAGFKAEWVLNQVNGRTPPPENFAAKDYGSGVTPL